MKKIMMVPSKHSRSDRRLEDGTEIPRHRDPCTGLPINKYDPLRDISGIQYFLQNAYRFVAGHVYYPDSPLALTSISQYSYFRDRLELSENYIGQQSFDIGDWYEIDPANCVELLRGPRLTLELHAPVENGHSLA